MHPGQSFYYRGDKKFHFLGSQVITTFSGLFSGIKIALGHHNDAGVLNRSIRHKTPRNIRLLGDDGYGNNELTIRADNFEEEIFQQEHREKRSIV